MGTTKQRVLEAVRRNRRLLKFVQQLTSETVAAWGVDEIDGTQAERDAFITDYVEEVYNDQQRSREGAGSGRQAVLVKLKKGRATAKHRFNNTPTWQQLCQAVEESFPEFEVEDFQLKDGDIPLKESNWFQFARNNQSITLQVLSSAVAFSSYSEDSLRTLLNTSGAVDMYDAAFPYAAYNQDALLHPGLASALGISKHGELMDLVGKELALRAWYTGDLQRHKEPGRRELISPLLFAAALLAGDIQVVAEYSATGTVAKGSIDYVLMFYWFSIVVMEGKLHEQLLEHSGQLAAGMRSVREQFNRTMLRKRKHEPEGEFSQVPSIGILSSGTQYIFFRYDPAAKLVTRTSCMTVPLVPGITAALAATQALPVIRRLVQAIESHKQALRSIPTLPNAVRHWNVGPAHVPECTKGQGQAAAAPAPGH
ncbi:hypothetical protein V8C86DRAFT_91887 [Haematococcus lacustris]